MRRDNKMVDNVLCKLHNLNQDLLRQEFKIQETKKSIISLTRELLKMDVTITEIEEKCGRDVVKTYMVEGK